jgi:HEAT repeat protein
MDAIDELVARFRTPSPNRLWLVDKLLLALPDRRAIDALLRAAADPADEEDVRCAALRVFHSHTPKNKSDRGRLVAVALGVLRSDPSALVRDYAVTALTRFADRPEVEAALVPLMTDRGVSRNVRSAAFQVLSRRGHETRRRLFRQLLADPDLAEEVRNYFSLHE